MRHLIIVAALLAPVASQASQFTIKNASSAAITALEVSEDGANWDDFDVGSGIAPGANGTATWSESTDNSNCEWHVRATYSDGSTSDSAAFDFCEEDLVIEFPE